MKNKITLGLLFFIGLQINAQVGINTSDPQATLDVNGSVRIQKRSMDHGQAVRLLGVDEQGVILELDMDENIYIEGDKVKYSDRKAGVNQVSLIGITLLDNLAGIIWPGATGDGKAIVRLTVLLGDVELTGIDMSAFTSPMDAHGYTLSLYSVSGEVKIKNQDNGSITRNQFILGGGSDITIKQYEMIKLMYDGILEKWIVMSKH
ncbi:hypothetical protein [Patiriisocius marinus]|uniref:Uncharacterized protein n=1 Tax=Patiriisocius marinus TaxID=1397112 RepID=A0A5J4J661_9FLAO|nr:hypothetical protein [Patiriisocius marinus]GER59967.1 hypothetical protein ULMA_20750 [Patiriisocius marinus]